MHKIIPLAFFWLLEFNISSFAQQNLILNGSFETPSIAISGNTVPTSWTSQYGPSLTVNGLTGWPTAKDGRQFVGIGTYVDGTHDDVSQTFSVANPGSYILTWFESTPIVCQDPACTYTNAPYVVTLTGGFTTQFQAYHGTTAWVMRSVPVTLSAGTHTLTFQSVVEPRGLDSCIDNVQLVAPCQAINFTPFYQSAGLNVPTSFGFPSVSCIGQLDSNGNPASDADGRALTKNGGCALCCLASMLSSFAAFPNTTPANLNQYLTSVNGYNTSTSPCNRNSFVNWDAICGFTLFKVIHVPANDATINNVTISDYLQTNFCGNGYRVIIQLQEMKLVNGFYVNSGYHFVLVTGPTNNDWTVFDPGWHSASDYPGNLLTLSGHLAGFTPTGAAPRKFNVFGVRTYRYISDLNGLLSGNTACPIELLITDPLGRRLGWDSLTQTDIFEIPGGTYTRDLPFAYDADDATQSEGDPTGIKTFSIPSPVGGSYKILAVGTGAGSFGVNLQTGWLGGGGQTLTYSGIAAAGVKFTNSFFVIMPPVITSISNVSSGVAFSFTTQTNVTYYVESKTNLTTTNWLPVQTNEGSGGILNVKATNASKTQFYHLRAQ